MKIFRKYLSASFYVIDREAINQYSYWMINAVKTCWKAWFHYFRSRVRLYRICSFITIQIVTILFKTNSDSLYYTSASAQFILRKYLGLPLLSNTKFSKFKSPRFSSSCFLRNSNLGKTKLVCVAHLLDELKTSNSNSKFKKKKGSQSYGIVIAIIIPWWYPRILHLNWCLVGEKLFTRSAGMQQH